MREHGGNLHPAKQVYGGKNWIDLSTGINRVPYPVPQLSAAAFTDLPGRDAIDLWTRAAGAAYRSSAPLLALAGAQAAIQLVPHLRPKGLARIVSPTYNEHGATLRACGWQVEEVARWRIWPARTSALWSTRTTRTAGIGVRPSFWA